MLSRTHSKMFSGKSQFRRKGKYKKLLLGALLIMLSFKGCSTALKTC